MTFVVLLVDDNFDHRFLTRRALRGMEREGKVKVVVAEDGEAAWQLLAGGLAPSLVLLDSKMPRRDGFELLRDVRADPALADLRIVMFSSSENRHDIERARASGADEYLTKPLDAKEFQEQVAATVVRWMASDQHA